MHKKPPHPNNLSQSEPESANAPTPGRPQADLKDAAARFQSPALVESLGQLTSSFGGFFCACTAMYLTIGTSYWIALPLALLAAGFLVRIFIIQHDCGHGSFFKSQRANHVLGLLCSLFTLTPFAAWRRRLPVTTVSGTTSIGE